MNHLNALWCNACCRIHINDIHDICNYEMSHVLFTNNNKKKEEKKSNHKDFIWKGIFVSVKFNLKECSISVKIKTDYKKTYIFVYSEILTFISRQNII